ncbi:MAG: hypothetical protein HEP71_04575 [Roseivirga sp.]|nr:hypothetical protein [Roseivirga sp.]
MTSKTNISSIFRSFVTFFSGLGSLAGLMSLAESKIVWKSYFAKVVSFYQEHISCPVRSFLDDVIALLNLDLPEIPDWFFDYLPIAGMFWFSLICAYSHRMKMSIFTIYWEIFKEMRDEFKKDFWQTAWGTSVLSIFIFILILTSPLFVIVFPLLIGGVVVGVLSMPVWFVWKAITVLIPQFIEDYYMYLIAAVTLFFAGAFFFKRDWLIKSGRSIVFGLPLFLTKTYRVLKFKSKRALRRLARTIPPQIKSIKKDLRLFLSIVGLQYKFAAMILFAFFTIVSLNYFLFS